MLISVTQTGGFAGIERVAKMDTDDLGVDEAQALADLIVEADFFTLPDRVAGEGVGADFLHYTITVQAGDRQRTVEFYDDGSPENNALRQLAAQVIQRG